MTKTIFFIAVIFFALSAGATTDEGKIKYSVNNGDLQSFDLSTVGLPEKEDNAKYDVIVVGGGLAGLASAVFLTDHHKKVLLLEKEPKVGGLASGGMTRAGVKIDRGAAYWTDTYREEQKILERIHLGDFKKKNPIHEPADTYFINGELYPGIWEEGKVDKETGQYIPGTLDKLPASFALFKYELERQNDDGLIPNQPLEAGPLDLDAKNAAQWINEMPKRLDDRLANWVPNKDKKDDENAEDLKDGLEIQKTFKDSGLKDMSDVIKLMDLYCRSALGTNADGVSALAFANFYISEIDTRYTTKIGTAQAAVNMEKILREFFRPAKIKTSSTVTKIFDEPQGVRVQYVNKGKLHEVNASYLVFAAQIKLAARYIDNFAKLAPEKAKVINGLEYANYSVHTVNLKGHPYKLSYDTWTRPADYSELDFTDVITAQWIDTKGFTKNMNKEENKDGVWTIYHPISPDWFKFDKDGKDICASEDPLCVSQKYSDVDSIKIAKFAIHRLLQNYSPKVKELSGQDIDITSVDTNRWPISVHIARPGHFTDKAKILREPVGHIFFGNNNMGTPAFEEALFRGHCAADNILVRSDPKFIKESWSLCPIEK